MGCVTTATAVRRRRVHAYCWIRLQHMYALLVLRSTAPACVSCKPTRQDNPSPPHPPHHHQLAARVAAQHPSPPNSHHHHHPLQHSPSSTGICRGRPGMAPLTAPSTRSSAACRPPSRAPLGSSTCLSWSSCWGRSSSRQRSLSADWTQIRPELASGAMPVGVCVCMCVLLVLLGVVVAVVGSGWCMCEGVAAARGSAIGAMLNLSLPRQQTD